MGAYTVNAPALIHHAGLAACMDWAAWLAAAYVSNNPIHVAPLPDSRASAQPGAAASACNISVIAGMCAVAAGNKSFPISRSCAIISALLAHDGGVGAMGENGVFCAVKFLKINGVGQGCNGLIKTTGNGGRAWRGNGVNSSPMPRIITGRACKHTGTSAPNDRQNFSISRHIYGCGSGAPHNCQSPRTVAAASLDAPPIPDAKGRFFVS